MEAAVCAFIGAPGAKAAQASILSFGMSILPSLGPGTVNIRLTEPAIVDKFFCELSEALAHNRCRQPAIACDLEIVNRMTEGIELVMIVWNTDNGHGH